MVKEPTGKKIDRKKVKSPIPKVGVRKVLEEPSVEDRNEMVAKFKELRERQPIGLVADLLSRFVQIIRLQERIPKMRQTNKEEGKEGQWKREAHALARILVISWPFSL